jgi:deoxyinosine 3'endonuclease (endonuclease V)
MQPAKKTISSQSLTSYGYKLDKTLKLFYEYQRKMAKKVVKTDQFDKKELISGIDVAYDENFSYSACIVLTKEKKLIEKAHACLITRFPYFSGYFALREAPAVKAVIKKNIRIRYSND